MNRPTDLEVLAADFANKRAPAGSAGNVHYSGGTFYSYAEPIARILTARRAWVTTTKFSTTTSKHRTAVFRALYAAGYEVIETPKPPEAGAAENAPVPPLACLDAALVRDALLLFARSNQASPTLARAAALADVFDSAARGDGAAALALYSVVGCTGGK